MGIVLGSNFDVETALPLDSRFVAADMTARDAIDSLKRYEGLTVYVLSESKNFQLVEGITNGDWIEVGAGGGASFAGEVEDLSTGDDQVLDYDPETPVIRFLDDTLDSIAGLDSTLAVDGSVAILANDSEQTCEIKHLLNSTADDIDTGAGANIPLKAHARLLLRYSGLRTLWEIVGSASVGGGASFAGEIGSSAGGADQVIDYDPAFPVVRLSDASLTSIAGVQYDFAEDGSICILVNETGNPIVVKNGFSGTDSSDIITGTQNSLNLNIEATLMLRFSGGLSKWEVIGKSPDLGGGQIQRSADQLTIGSSGTITVDQTKPRQLIKVAGSGGPVNLDTIEPIENGTSDLQELYLVGADNAYTVTILESSTNIVCNGNIELAYGERAHCVWLADDFVWLVTKE